MNNNIVVMCLLSIVIVKKAVLERNEYMKKENKKITDRFVY